MRMSWSIGSEKSFGHVPPVGVELPTSWVQGEHPRPGSSLNDTGESNTSYVVPSLSLRVDPIWEGLCCKALL